MIKLSPETEQRLRATAARDGRDADELADALLAYALEHEEAFWAEERQAIQEGLDAALAGREKSWREFLAEQREKFPVLQEADLG